MTAWNIPAAIVAGLLFAGCSAQQPEAPAQHRPQQAGQPMDPVRVILRGFDEIEFALPTDMGRN